MKFTQWLIARLKERSTWLGITGAVAALGVFLSPEQIEAIVTLGVAVASALAVLWPDAQPTETSKEEPKE